MSSPRVYISLLFKNDTFEIYVLSNTNIAIDLCLEKQYDNVRETNKQTNTLFRPKPLVQPLPSESVTITNFMNALVHMVNVPSQNV